MDATEYQLLAMRTNDERSQERLEKRLSSVDLDFAQMVHAALGLTGESGEVSDLIKKTIFHEKEFDLDHLKKELGDVAWYLTLMCDAIGADFSEILHMNNDKLEKRYTGAKFNIYEANHRKEGDI